MSEVNRQAIQARWSKLLTQLDLNILIQNLQAANVLTTLEGEYVISRRDSTVMSNCLLEIILRKEDKVYTEITLVFEQSIAGSVTGKLIYKVSHLLAPFDSWLCQSGKNANKHM